MWRVFYCRGVGPNCLRGDSDDWGLYGDSLLSFDDIKCWTGFKCGFDKDGFRGIALEQEKGAA